MTRDVPTPAPPPGFLRRHAVKLVASVLITAGVVYAAEKGGLKLVPDGGDFRAVRWWGLAAYVPIFTAMTWFRSVRWRFLLRSITEVPRVRLLAVSCAGFLAILLLPFRLGELVRPYLLRTRPEDRVAGRPVLTMTAATSSIVAERVLDGLFLSVVLAIALLVVPHVEPLPARVVGLPVSVAYVRRMGFAMLGVFTAALVVVAVFYAAHDWAVRATRFVIGRISPRLADKLAGIATSLADGLHVLRRGRDALGFLAETAAYWGCNIVGLWLLAVTCGVVHADGTALSFGEACALMGMMGCTVLIPGPPGLLGVFQAGLYAGMTMYLPTAIVTGPGAAFVFLLYVSQVALTLIMGSWGAWRAGGVAQSLDADRDEVQAVARREPAL